ncbi:MAG: hypothetical protein PPP55_10560 [Halorubrum sp.]
MSDSLYERYGRQVIGGIILALATLSLVSGYFRIGQEGLTAVGEVAVSLYIAGVVLWGLLDEGFDTVRFRIALYVGMVAWGVSDFVAGTDSVVSLVVLVVGGILLTRAVYGYVQRRRKPVYERR